MSATPTSGYTLADVIKVNFGKDNPIVDEVLVVAPELSAIPVRVIPGTSMPVTVRTGIPDASFRLQNQGVSPSKVSYETREFATAILEHRLVIDERQFDAAVDPVRFMEDHYVAAYQAIVKAIGSQFYYGNPSGTTAGFPGLNLQALAANEINAGGSTAKTSAWMLQGGRNAVEIIFGSGQQIVKGKERLETAYDADGKAFSAIVNTVSCRVGVVLTNKNRAFRIKNIGTDTGKGLTETLLWSAWERAMEVGANPTDILMNIRSSSQLRASLGTNPVTGRPFPPLMDFESIPVTITASITNAE